MEKWRKPSKSLDLRSGQVRKTADLVQLRVKKQNTEGNIANNKRHLKLS